MKKIIIGVTETVSNRYTFEVTAKDFDEDMLDTLGDMIEAEYRNTCMAEDTDYTIQEFMMDKLGLEAEDFNIDSCVDEAYDVETEIDDLFVVGV